MTLQVLHLVGGTTDFYAKLSRMYAQSCLEATSDPARYSFCLAYISPDRRWRFPASLEPGDIESAPAYSQADALAMLAQQKIDVALPQMFCIPGMTEYRALLEAQQIPYVGNRPEVMAATATKAQAKAAVAAAGLAVPAGQILQQGDRPTLAPPVIVKPNDADNSLGVSLVMEEADYSAAIAAALRHSRDVLVEQYIPLGREVRCGLVEQGDRLIELPLQEYRLDSRQPIRTYDHKLVNTDQDTLALTPKAGKAWMVPQSDPIVAAVWPAAKQAHRALGCRHYSLFDFRIDPQGRPWFIEAGLYCSFGPRSVIGWMMTAAGTSLPDFFDAMLRQAI